MEQTPQISNADLENLLKQLGSRNQAEQSQAEQTLRRMGPQGAEALIAFLRRERPKRSARFSMHLFAFMTVTTMVSMTVLMLAHHFKWIFSLYGVVGGISANWAAWMAVPRGQKNAARILATFEDVRAIGPLLDALRYPGRTAQRAAAAGLVRLLPRLHASDAALLDTEERGLLNTVLTGSNIELILAALKALEQIGDASALPNVKKLASGRGIAAKQAYIQEAARECLSYLQERSAERNSQTLLRPSSAAGDTLLRPAASTEETAPQTLLRPSSRTGEPAP